MTSANSRVSEGPRHYCLGCDAPLPPPFLDLGRTPLANGYVPAERLDGVEETFPLTVSHCTRCQLVQLTHLVSPKQLFGHYLYFSSYSETFLGHARAMADALVEALGLGPSRRVLEIASNDGYLLQYFQKRGLAVLGVEPAANVAAHARARGIPTLGRFFGCEAVPEVLETFGAADLVVGNNVLAHVPAINDFLEAVRHCLRPAGAAVFEFPWVREMLERTEFDTIYHEHVFYLSLAAVRGLAARAGLEVFDASAEAIHGGSLRVWLQQPGIRPVRPDVEAILEAEDATGCARPARYARFRDDVSALRRALVTLLRDLKSGGHRLAAYGAPAKGSTLLNYLGIGRETLDFVADRSPHKQRHYMPGVRVPIVPPSRLLEAMPAYVLLLTWNFADEILAQQAEYRQRGGRFIIPVPSPRVI